MQVLHRGADDGPGHHSQPGLRPQRHQARQHAARRRGTPQAGRLRHVHEDGRGGGRGGEGESCKLALFQLLLL